MARLTANWPIKIDGKRVETGEPFDCSDERGEELLASGSASRPEKSTESGGKDAAPGSANDSGGELSQDERNAKIREALQAMIAEDPAQQNNLLWTKAGDPRNKTVDQRAGIDVANDELAPIWAELKP